MGNKQRPFLQGLLEYTLRVSCCVASPTGMRKQQLQYYNLRGENLLANVILYHRDYLCECV